MSSDQLDAHFEEFYVEVYEELASRYGISAMHVCENIGDHMSGNVYVRFRQERQASRAVRELNNRWFAGHPIYAELSPVADFRDAVCRQHENGECQRGGYCNFMHIRPLTRRTLRCLESLRRSHRSRSEAPSFDSDASAGSVASDARKQDHLPKRYRVDNSSSPGTGTDALEDTDSGSEIPKAFRERRVSSDEDDRFSVISDDEREYQQL
ncbi:splicing factor U2af subunit-like protein, partial [Aphelenchoides avenae]